MRRQIDVPGIEPDQPHMLVGESGTTRSHPDETNKEHVLAFCQDSDRLLQLILGDTARRTLLRWGPVLILVTLAAAAAAVAGLPPRLGLWEKRFGAASS
jgi:hypothetical protein